MAILALILSLFGVSISASHVRKSPTISQGDTVFVLELTRHGARAPIGDVIKYIKRDWIKNFGAGELTDVGMR